MLHKTSSSPSLASLRRFTATLLGKALIDTIPNVSLIRGGCTDIGFYYDFIVSRDLHDEMIPILEERIRSYVHEDPEVKTFEMMRKNAVSFFEHHGQRLIAEVLKTRSEDLVTLVKIGDFHDLAEDSNITTCSTVKAFKIQKIEILNFELPNGDKRGTRVSGTCFFNPQELKKFIKNLEHMKKRDHRVLGKELNLFDTDESVASGFCFWHGKGGIIYEILLDWWKKTRRTQHYQLIHTPSFLKASFLEKSGYQDDKERNKDLFYASLSSHFDKKQSNYYVATPTHAPCHAIVYKAQSHFSRELPLRFAECAPLFSSDKKGGLWGMFRTHSYTADSCHIFCTVEQVRDELKKSLTFIADNMKLFGLSFRFSLSQRGRSYAGIDQEWTTGRKFLKQALADLSIEYDENDEDFSYEGPRINIYLQDALGREWIGPHLGFDFSTPKRFALDYQAQSGNSGGAPMMITSAFFGSLERFIAILIENFAGVFPLWLAPEQVRIIPLTEKNQPYAQELLERIAALDLRVSMETRNDKLATKIHSSQCEKIPYTLVVGDREEQQRTATVRLWNQKEKQGVSVEKFIEHIQLEISQKTVKLSFGEKSTP